MIPMAQCLERKIRHDARVVIATGAALFLGGLLLIGMTWAFLCMVHLQLALDAASINSWAFVRGPTILTAILCIVGLLLRPNPDDAPAFANPRAAPSPPPRRGMGASRIAAMGRALVSFLLFGPRLTRHAVEAMQRGLRMSRIDVTACAPVVEALWRAGHRLSYAEIVQAVPGIDPVRVFPQMAEIDGVLLLRKEPAGLALQEVLKEQIDVAMGSRL